MTGTNTKLTAAVEACFADLGRVRASGGATGAANSPSPPPSAGATWRAGISR